MSDHDSYPQRPLDRSAYGSGTRGVRGPSTCRHPGCHGTTREQKPFCLEHVLLNPQAAVTARGIRQYEEAIRLLRSRGARKSDASGVLAHELTIKLRDRGGSASLERLARDMRLRPTTIAALVGVMDRAGKVVITKSARGVTIASLVEPGGH